MILKETLRQVIKSQHKMLQSLDLGITRDVLPKVDLNLSHATFLTGIRRCGKTTLLHQLMQTIENFSFFNFEDTRVNGFESVDFPKLESVLNEEYGANEIFFFDEIQRAPQWEIFIRSLPNPEETLHHNWFQCFSNE